MPSALHRGIIELLRRDLSIVAELVYAVLGLPPPEGLTYEERDGRLVAYSFVSKPREIAADLVVLARHADVPGCPPHIVMTLEAQLGLDEEKRFRLLEYIAAARRDHRCSGLSSLFSPNQAVIDAVAAMFAAEPHFCPVLVGPSAVPIILTVEEAIRRPTLATLSAIVHARGEHAVAILETVIESWRHLEESSWRVEARTLWACIPKEVMSKLNDAIQIERANDWGDDELDDLDSLSEWEKGTNYYWHAARLRDEGRAEGRAEGRRRSLELVLSSRGLIPTDEQRATIDACDSIETLERWIVRASTVASVAELLEP